MTSMNIPESQLPPASFFLESVCPGLSSLDDNTHFSTAGEVPEQVSERLAELNWPLTSSAAFPAAVKAKLSSSYLHVARPPFQHDVHKNVESSTYVSLPYHVTSIFSKIVDGHHSSIKQDGGLHIGANVNPLTPDPYRLVHMNPGCLTSMIVLANERANDQTENRNPFRNMTSSLNRFLRMGASPVEEGPESPFVSLLNAIPESSPHFITHPQLGGSNHATKRNSKNSNSKVFAKLLDFDSKTYYSQVKSTNTKKLLVSTNVNVINVFGIDKDHKLTGTKESNSTSAIFPLTEERDSPAPSSTTTATPGSQPQQQPPPPTILTTTCKPYKKVIEVPLLRLQLQPNLMVTSLLTLVCMETLDPIVILGLNSGAILAINLAHLTYRFFDNLGLKPSRDGSADASWTNVSVTSLSAITHTKYELLVIAGYANGEVVLIDLLGSESDIPYAKREVGHDSSITLFKKFDLSPLNKLEDSTEVPESPGYIVGHFKLSHKPITSIASTIPYSSTPPQNLMKNPFIVAIASDDGLVRLIDLLNTHNKNYGDPQNFYNHSIVSDIVASYFQDGIRHIEFSPDHRFFTIGGKGDLIEVFKMTYYNINGLINKKSGHQRGRSRSGTVNSGNSFPQHAPSLFLSTTESATTSTSLDFGREDTNEAGTASSCFFPPMIKDITIVSRLKGHTNTVEKVSFVQKDELSKSHIQDNSPSSAYKLMSCGADGKVIIWDFDSKAVSRVKKGHLTTRKKKDSKEKENAEPTTHQQALQPVSSRVKPLSNNLPPTIAVTKAQHSRARSLSYNDENGFTKSPLGNIGISKILSPSPQRSTHSIEDDDERQKIVVSLYRWLFEIRLKRHFSGSNVAKDGRKKYTSIIHKIVNDEELPSIQIPSLEVDFSYFLRDGKIQSYSACPDRFYIFGRNGDIFSYLLE
ncbi:hypothetical protein FT663_00299 [Candidozyma haemuli var. vulneris]|nr:hypothetical protein FT662_00835 [[Candida] haemuloni var. vulneris]KAF3995552.1 hypothetical protein FT663_00299 [[Candida] haemuloni var. vulneris]